MDYEGLKIVEATPRDSLAVAEVLNGAYDEAENGFYRTVFPLVPQSELIKNMALRWPKEIYKPNTWHLKLEDASTGEMMSYSRWVLPDHVLKQLDHRPALTEEEREKFTRDFDKGSDNGAPRGLNRQFADMAEEELEEARKAFPENHIVLDMIMTRPRYKGQGAAAKHIEWGLTLADKERLPIVLEATPTAKGLYLKFGFEVVAEVNHDLSTGGGKGFYVHTLMVRPAAIG